MTNDDIKVPDIEHATYIEASPQKVYETLTTGQGWDAWFTHGAVVESQPGGEIKLRWENFGAERVTMEDGGPVLEVEPNRKLIFQWSPGVHRTTVRITLESLGNGTLVKLVESGYSLEDDDLECLVRCASGWGEALTLLKFYLEQGIVYQEVPLEKPTRG